MAHDSDISFGDVEETRPERARRPDKNRHFAVVAYGEPVASDLPIFVDLDVLLDMETHALSDTNVELGGVMLGGQFEDDDGNPFVVVTDSLRAEHYEATKGSFKFTHETWQQISRQRDEYPENVAMVGWYHTHPDWSVFLSGMDTFICDHFFNRPLDVALVIDPCRQDRGWFQWTGLANPRQRRTAGFYVIASRYRQEELEFFVAQLEGKQPMRATTGYAVTGSSPAPIVNIHEEKAGWLGTAVMGILVMQFLFMVLIAGVLLAQKFPGAEPTDADKKIAALTKQVEELKQQSLDTARLADRTRLLDSVVEKLDPTAAGTVRKLVEAEDANMRLKAASDGYRMKEQEFTALKKDHDGLEIRHKAEVEARKKKESDLSALAEKFSALTKELETAKKVAEVKAGEADPWSSLKNPYTLAALAAATVVIGGLAAAMLMQRAPPPQLTPLGEIDPPTPPPDNKPQ